MAAGAAARKVDPFMAEPLAQEGITICVNGETVMVYSFPTHEAAVAASRRIEPDDPSNIGTAIIEWDGSPKFWGRDRILVLYVGRDDLVTGLFIDLIGQPFAHAVGRAPMLRLTC